MKRIFYIVWLMSLTGIFGLTAQDLNLERHTIFDALEESVPGKGDVIVNQSPAIERLVGARMYGSNIERTETVTYIKVQGYRVQVFSGNNQRVSKDEALKKEKEINEKFPEVETYVKYIAPFWRLRVGDYGSHEQAYYLLRQLQNTFPKYKEMTIVRDEVKLPLHDDDWGY